jgi:hypothetical protein
MDTIIPTKGATCDNLGGISGCDQAKCICSIYNKISI